jgi:hypothetical protein
MGMDFSLLGDVLALSPYSLVEGKFSSAPKGSSKLSSVFIRTLAQFSKTKPSPSVALCATEGQLLLCALSQMVSGIVSVGLYCCLEKCHFLLLLFKCFKSLLGNGSKFKFWIFLSNNS